jgi:hypothetical protein
VISLGGEKLQKKKLRSELVGMIGRGELRLPESWWRSCLNQFLAVTT